MPEVVFGPFVDSPLSVAKVLKAAGQEATPILRHRSCVEWSGA